MNVTEIKYNDIYSCSKNKYLEVNLTKHVQGIYAEKYKC